MQTLKYINQVVSTPYHHVTIGSWDRVHNVLNEYFWNMISQNEWTALIDTFIFAYNTIPLIVTLSESLRIRIRKTTIPTK